jgi:hypothetical protein
MLESYVITYVLSTVSGAPFIFWIVLAVNLVGDGLPVRGRRELTSA